MKPLCWANIKEDSLSFSINQAKTTAEVRVTLHSTVKRILDKRRARLQPGIAPGKVFMLPTAEGALKILDQWCQNAGLKKHITWHCARLSFSILLQDANVDTATVALLLGQSNSPHVHETYKRHRLQDLTSVIAKFQGWNLFLHDLNPVYLLDN